VIKVKENAPELLRKALSRLPVDVVITGDYQPAEKKFEISRRMLEVCLDLGFPVSVLERSPLVLRDLDLLKEINQRAPSVVFFSMISAPDSPTYDLVCQMENLAPRMEKRYAAMEQIAKAGILTGISMMPILPGLCDIDENLEAIIRCTANHGGRFVVAGGLTLADQQLDFFYGVLRDRFPDLLPLYERMYPHPTASYGGGSQRGPACDGAEDPGAVPAVWDRGPDAQTDHPGRQAGAEQADRGSAGEPVLLDGAGQCPRPAGVGPPQGGVGDRGPRAGRGADLSPDGAERAREHRECGAAAGGGR